MSIFEYLVLRSEFEETVKSFRYPNGNAHRKSGTIENMEYFLTDVAKKNRFRDGCDRATEIAYKCVDKYA